MTTILRGGRFFFVGGLAEMGWTVERRGVVWLDAK